MPVQFPGQVLHWVAYLPPYFFSFPFFRAALSNGPSRNENRFERVFFFLSPDVLFGARSTNLLVPPPPPPTPPPPPPPPPPPLVSGWASFAAIPSHPQDFPAPDDDEGHPVRPPAVSSTQPPFRPVFPGGSNFFCLTLPFPFPTLNHPVWIYVDPHGHFARVDFFSAFSSHQHQMPLS